MMTLITAAVLAAQSSAVPAPANAQPQRHMQIGQSGALKGLDCCKDCCKDMGKHEEHGSEHSEHRLTN